jgi:tetratricopeptide (TPR) repeat protein
MTRRRFVLLIGFTFALNIAAFAQPTLTSPQPEPGQQRNFDLYGDLRMLELDGETPKNALFDLVLYPRGANEAFARQRVGKGGRYRFNSVPEGNYLVAVEFNHVEIARVAIIVGQRKGDEIRQDLELEWTADVREKIGNLPAPDSYTRTNQNRELYERALKEINKNDLTKATATLRSLVEADPKDFAAWNQLGMVYFIQKNLAAAETSYGKAIELRPDSVIALVSLARVRLAQKNNEGAVAALESALKADPKSAVANYFLGEAYLALKKGSVAVGYLNEAVKLDPVAMAQAHLRLAALYHLAGHKELAAVEYNEFLKKRPEYPEGQKLRDYIMANGPRAKSKPAPSPSPGPSP